MSLSHTVFKKLIETEIPIQRPALTESEMKHSDSTRRMADVFNQLHVDMFAKAQWIQWFFEWGSTPRLPLVLIKIIFEYCSKLDFAYHYEKYRCQGVKDILPNEYLTLFKDDACPLILHYRMEGDSKGTITAGLQPQHYSVVNAVNFPITVMWTDSSIPCCRTLYHFPKDTISRNKINGEFYSDGLHVIDSALPNIADDVDTFEPRAKESLVSNCLVIKIPDGHLADVKLKKFLSYTLAPTDFCSYRVFEGRSVELQKIYDPNPSSFWGFFGCKRKKIEGIARGVECQQPPGCST